MARRQPAATPRTPSSCSRSAAATSRRTSARTSCARCSTPERVGATIVGIVGRDGGYTAKVADACVIVPTVNPDDRHAALRGVPGGGLAPARVASAAQGGGDQVGVDAVTSPGGLPRSRRRAQPRHRARRQAVSAGSRSTSSRSCRASPPALAPAQGGGLRADRRDQPARRRARPADARGRRGDQRRARGARCRSTNSASATTTTRDDCAVPQAEAGPADCRRRSYDLRAQLHGRRPLARHRGRPPRRRAGRRFSIDYRLRTSRTPRRAGRPRLDRSRKPPTGFSRPWRGEAHEACRRLDGSKIFADGADLDGHAGAVPQAAHQGLHDQSDADAQGRHHATIARSRSDVLAAIPDRPISFEVFSDEFAEMERQAREIATWGENVYVKIPVTNTQRESRVRS